MEKVDIEINRYVHTYVEYLLNRLKQIVNKNDREDIEKLLENNAFNNYSNIQLNRIINDNRLKLDFSIYESLENYRKLYELYDIEKTEESRNNVFTYKNLGNNKYLVTYNPFNKDDTDTRLLALNKKKYEFQIKVKDGTNIEEILANERDLLLALRNSDAHGDNEVLIDGINKQVIKFNCTGNIEEINIGKNDFSNLVYNKSKEMYLKSLDTDYGLIKKNYDEENTVENPITNENELDIVLEKFDIAKFKDKASEIEEDKDIIEYFNRRNRFYVITTATYPSLGIRDKDFPDHDKVESFEISQEDKEYIKNHINTIDGFYNKNYIEQHAIITQIIKKRYMPSKYYALENITKKAMKSSAYTYEIEKNTIFKYSYEEEMLQEDEIKEIVSLIIKAVFLTNKNKFNEISEQINLDGFERKLPNRDITNTRTINRIRNAFTHYRFLYNKEVNSNDNLDGILTEDDIKNDIQRFNAGEEKIELKTPMLIYDCNKRQDNKLTYLANTTLFHFLEFTLQSSLIHEISEQTKGDNEGDFENIGNAEQQFIYIQNILDDPTFFKNLDETTRRNKDLIKFALLCDWKNIEYVDKEVFEEDKEFLKECIDLVPFIYENLKGHYSDSEIFNYALSRNGSAVLCADKVFFTKENVIKAIEKLKEDDDVYPINDITCNIPDEFFYDYEFSKKFSILRESIKFLHREKFSEIYSKLLNDEEVAIAVKDIYFKANFTKEMKENPRIIKERIEYKKRNEKINIENREKRKSRQKMLKIKKEEIYLKFMNESKKEKMKRIAVKASTSGVLSEGEVLLNATKDKKESEIGDNDD